MRENGMTLAELLVVLVIFLLVGLALTTAMIFHQRSFLQENKRVMIKSQIRTAFIELQERISQAGAGINVAGTKSYLGADSNVPFRGIIPMNYNTYDGGGNDDNPDGIILAYGDTRTITKLSAGSWHPPSTTMVLEKVKDPVSGESMWNADDIGMIMSKEGFYMFKVTAVNTDTDTLTLRNTAVYYSGLFNYSDMAGPIHLNYLDFLPHYLNPTTDDNGKAITYNRDTSSVIKLSFFGIYFISRINNSYYLTASLDADGNANPCSNGFGPERCVPLAKNILDMQIEYIVPDPVNPTNPPDLYCTYDPSYAGNAYRNPSFQALYDVIVSKQVKSMKITLSGATERFREKYQSQLIIKTAGDRDSLTLTGTPWNHMKLYQLNNSFDPRNFFSVY